MSRLKKYGRVLIHLSLVLVLFSCQSNADSADSLEKDTMNTEADFSEDAVGATTAVPVMVYSMLTEPFFLDTVDYDTIIVYEDTGAYYPQTEYSLFGYFPQSKAPEHKMLNAKIRDVVDAYLFDYLPEGGEEKDGFMTIEASIWLTSFDIEADVVSILFSEQSYAWGAAHFNHGYVSLNYDLKEEKEIKLTDLLLFRNEEEKQKFCDAFNPDPTTTINEVMLEAGDFSPEQDFTVNWSELTLWFDDYAKGPSWDKVYIPRSKFQLYVPEKYKRIFEY